MSNDKSYRGIRGGGWYFDTRSAQVAFPFKSIPSLRDDALGFRLSRIVNPLEQLSEVIHEQ